MFAAKMPMAKVPRTLDDNIVPVSDGRLVQATTLLARCPLCWHAGGSISFPFFGSETDKIGLDYREKNINWYFKFLTMTFC